MALKLQEMSSDELMATIEKYLPLLNAEFSEALHFQERYYIKLPDRPSFEMVKKYQENLQKIKQLGAFFVFRDEVERRAFYYNTFSLRHLLTLLKFADN